MHSQRFLDEEARRLAKEVVRNRLKANGVKISTVKHSDIVKAAELLINQPTIRSKARIIALITDITDPTKIGMIQALVLKAADVTE